MAEHYVIIGNGPAANTAATTLREHTRAARITVIGRENSAFYRPDLLPRYVAGRIEEEDLYVLPLTHYPQEDIKLRLGQEVVRVDFAGKELTLAHKEVVGYDGLIIATGGMPRIPEPLVAYQEMFLTLKTLNDARLWKQKIGEVDTVALVGGDLTSLAFARELLALGKRITFVLDDRCFWPLHPDDTAKAEVISRLEARGIEVVDGKTLKAVTREGDFAYTLATLAGPTGVGLVGAFFGLRPNVGFLDRSGLQIETGILVDETLQTSFEMVYAAGDCAQVYSPKLRDYWVSIGYRNARNLGRVAALNLLGSRVEADTAESSIFEVEGISVSSSWWTEF